MNDKIFEITHDSLAAKIWEKVSAEEKLQIEVSNFIASAYKNYSSRKDLLSKKNIEYILPYLDKLKLNEGEEDFIKRSRRFYTHQKAGLISIVSIIFLLLTTALVLTLLSRNTALNAQQESLAEKHKAENSLKAFQREKAVRQSLEVDELFNKANSFIKAGYRKNSDTIFAKILSMDSTQKLKIKIDSLKTISVHEDILTYSQPYALLHHIKSTG